MTHGQLFWTQLKDDFSPTNKMWWKRLCVVIAGKARQFLDIANASKSSYSNSTNLTEWVPRAKRMAPLFILDAESFYSTAKSTVCLFRTSPLWTARVSSACDVRIWLAVDLIKSFKLFWCFWNEMDLSYQLHCGLSVCLRCHFIRKGPRSGHVKDEETTRRGEKQG